MDLLKIIGDAWGWCGIEPLEVVESNAFGSLIVKTRSGEYWRICPEELSATRLAGSAPEFQKVRSDPDFVADWEMAALVEEANHKLGHAGEGRCYCLKIPGVLGGEYGGDNFATIEIAELIASSGNLAFQVKDVPDGGKINLEVKKAD